MTSEVGVSVYLETVEVGETCTAVGTVLLAVISVCANRGLTTYLLYQVHCTHMEPYINFVYNTYIRTYS